MKEYSRRAGVGIRGFVGGGFSLVCCLVAWGSQCARAQQIMPPDSSEQKVSSDAKHVFAADLDILAKRWQIAFVAEGEPVPVGKEQPAPMLSERLSQEDAVKEIADYFDYAVVHQGNAYLLTKRYSKSEDLPDVTPAECLMGLKAISKILSTFNPKIPPETIMGAPIAGIARLLTAGQLEKMGKDGLSVSELTPPQHEELWRLALSFYVQTHADAIEEIYTPIANRNPADPTFHWQTVRNIHAFGYDTRAAALNDLVFVTLTDSDRIRVYPNGMTVLSNSVNGQTGAPIVTHDPLDPALLPGAIKTLLDEKDKVSHAVTLAEAITALNRRTADGKTYKVDPIYAQKHVTLVGAERLSANTLVRSLADVYGLRIAREEDGSVILTHPTIPEVKQLSDMPRALQSAVPVPIFRMLRKRVPHENENPADSQTSLLLIDYLDKAGATYGSAMRMFLYAAEAAAKARPNEKVALSQLDERVRNVFAFAGAVGAFSRAAWIADRPAPPYIADIEHITLTGGISHNTAGAERFSLFFSYRDPKTGAMYKGIGFSNAVIPP